MADEKTDPSIPVFDDALDRRLWGDLSDLEQEPSAQLRPRFYRELNTAQAAKRSSQLLLRQGILAAACLVLGVWLGGLFAGDRAMQGQLDELRDEVAELNAAVVQSMLAPSSASDRLSAVDTLRRLERNPRVAVALLDLATHDPNTTVRTAAIAALADYIDLPTIGASVERLARESKSPLVQLAVVQLLMRAGDSERRRRLIDWAQSDVLLPEVNRFIVDRFIGAAEVRT